MVTRRTYAGRAIGFAHKQVAGIGQRIKDQIYPSYLPSPATAGGLLRYVKPISRQLLLAHETRLGGLATNYLAHRFDLLGSGWVRVESWDALPGN